MLVHVIPRLLSELGRASGLDGSMDFQRELAAAAFPWEDEDGRIMTQVAVSTRRDVLEHYGDGENRQVGFARATTAFSSSISK